MIWISSQGRRDRDAVAKAGSTPAGSASACGGLGIHRLVVTSDVAKRDPGHVAQWQSGGLMKPRVAGSIPAVLSIVHSLLPSMSSIRTKPSDGRVPRGTVRMPPFLASLNWISSRSNVFGHM